MGRANIRHGFPIKVVQIHDDCGCGVGGRSAGVRGTDAGSAEAQGPNAAGSQPTMLDRMNQMLAGGKSAWTDEQLAHDGTAARCGDEERLRV